jgi:hypothetical protein
LALQKLAYRSEAEIYDDYTIPPLTQTLGEMRADEELTDRVTLVFMEKRVQDDN